VALRWWRFTTSGVGKTLDVIWIVISLAFLFSPEIASKLDIEAVADRRLAAVPLLAFLVFSVFKAVWDEARYWETEAGKHSPLLRSRANDLARELLDTRTVGQATVYEDDSRNEGGWRRSYRTKPDGDPQTFSVGELLARYGDSLATGWQIGLRGPKDASTAAMEELIGRLRIEGIVRVESHQEGKEDWSDYAYLEDFGAAVVRAIRSQSSINS